MGWSNYQSAYIPGEMENVKGMITGVPVTLALNHS